MPVTIYRTIIARLLTLTKLLATADCPLVHVTLSLAGFYYHYIRYFAIFNGGLAISKNRVNDIRIWLSPKESIFVLLFGGLWLMNLLHFSRIIVFFLLNITYFTIKSQKLSMYVAIFKTGNTEKLELTLWHTAPFKVYLTMYILIVCKCTYYRQFVSMNESLTGKSITISFLRLVNTKTQLLYLAEQNTPVP